MPKCGCGGYLLILWGKRLPTNLSLALARKYRPRDFRTLVGQEITVQALTNALDNQRLHHAYLFSGMRGVGKTTLARILAKCLNCEKGISSSPCGVCSICVAIDEGRFVDLIEVDAASRTKVEDTRELLDNVQYLPTQGRFKVYLIDEVHMLSGHSFNALLKTLEEPPLHVKFLLATTDPQKLPVTVLSRCLQFHLRRLSTDKIVAHLSQILLQEGTNFEKEALQLLSVAAEGSLRDALSLLDQSLSFCNGKITVEGIRCLLGLTSERQVFLLLSAIVEGNVKNILALVEQLLEYAVDFTEVLSSLIMMLHQMAIAQFCSDAVEETLMVREDLLKLATQLEPETIQLYYQIALQGSRDLPYAPNPKIGFEMILLRMVAFQPVTIANANTNISSNTPRNTSANILANTASNVPQNSEMTTKKIPLEIPSEIPSEAFAEISSIDWNRLVETLPLTGMSKALAEHCILTAIQNETFHLALDSSQKPLLTKRHEDKLREVLGEHFSKSVRLNISLAKTTLETPAVLNQRRLAEKQRVSREKVEADSKIQELIKTFDAKVEQITYKEE